VGKSTLDEALDSAMERLRLEFVQRGSRSASGSTAEQICLEYVTGELRAILLGLQRPYERAVIDAVARLVEEAPYWQELRLERSFKTQAPGVPLNPPRLLAPIALCDLLPASDAARQTPQQLELLTAFIAKTREELPLRLDAEIRQNALQFAKQLAAERPLGVPASEVQRFLLTRRTAYNQIQTDRWRKVAATVQKQLTDWLRTASFTVNLVVGADQRRQEIDDTIASLSAGWRLERQVAVDRNILRLAGYEILFLAGVPTGVAINEAVELAKKYSTTESGRFVNGVLGALATKIGEKPRTGTSDGVFAAEAHNDTLDVPDFAAIEDDDLIDESDLDGSDLEDMDSEVSNQT
jgi:N utilization substance protein B